MPSNDTSLPRDADQVVVAVNPKAGTRSADDRLHGLIDLLRDRGFRPEVLTDLAEVAERANRFHAEGRLRALVGVGGDGTAAELVNRTNPGVPLTMLSAGNENLLARYLNLGQSPREVCRTIAEGVVVRLDAGRVAGRIFLLMISCGFDAEVVRRVHAQRTGHINRRHYVKTIWDLLRSYEYPELRIYWGDAASGGAEPDPAPATARWLFGFNLPCYGGGFQFAPQAQGTDGLLDVLTFRRGSFWHGLRYAAAVRLGRHQRMADCEIRRTRRVRIASDAEVPYQLDGDPGGLLPIEVEMLPERLTLLVPPAGAM